jgi:phosphotriesterase-related protein
LDLVANIETVRGPIAPADLGPTLTHEHIFVLDLALIAAFQTDFEEEQAVATAVRRLTELKATGIDTIVDPTVLGIGRNLPLVQRVAEQVDLNIVVATGLFTTNELPTYFHYRHILRPAEQGDVLTEMFVRDIREGIKGTGGVKAGILKCATDKPGVTPDVERVLRATAAAHRETGVPIMTHTDAASRGGLEQQAIFADEGVDLSRVLIGHCGDTDDLDYLEELLRNGSYLGLDRFGADRFLTVDERIRVVLELCERGWAERLTLSHDADAFNDWFDPEWVQQTHPRWRYELVPEEVLPELRSRGLPEATVTTMMVENARRLLQHAGGY